MKSVASTAGVKRKISLARQGKKKVCRSISRELRESMNLGFALEMTEEEARNKLGTDLVVASLGAQVKEEQGDEVKLRLLFDGTHGVPVNERIRVRERGRVPSAPDIKKVLGY